MSNIPDTAPETDVRSLEFLHLPPRSSDPGIVTSTDRSFAIGQQANLFSQDPGTYWEPKRENDTPYHLVADEGYHALHEEEFERDKMNRIMHKRNSTIRQRYHHPNTSATIGSGPNAMICPDSTSSGAQFISDIQPPKLERQSPVAVRVYRPARTPRHAINNHSVTRKVWICKHSLTGGLHPIVALSSCATCRDVKTYAVAYDAIVHLRRSHFITCKNEHQGREKASEGRGSMSGEPQPATVLLENWISEQLEVRIGGTVTLLDIVPTDDVSWVHAEAGLVAPSNGRRPSTDSDSDVESDGELSFVATPEGDMRLDISGTELDPRLFKLQVSLADILIRSFINCSNTSQGASRKRGTFQSSSRSSRGSRAHQSSQHTTSICAVPPRKRSRDSDDDDGDCNYNDSGRQQLRLEAASTVNIEAKLLACSYSKHDSRRYSQQNLEERHYRGCTNCYATTIARLKQHLYRVHRRPIHHCARCFASFTNKERLDNHNREDPPCQVSTCPFDEKMTTNQMAEIKRRRPYEDQSKLWFDIFRTLFPGSELPWTPYAESVSEEAAQRFISHFRSTAPAILSELVRLELQDRILLHDEEQRILEDALEGGISGLVQRFGSEFSTRLNTPEAPSIQLADPTSTGLPSQPDAVDNLGVSNQFSYDTTFAGNSLIEQSVAHYRDPGLPQLHESSLLAYNPQDWELFGTHNTINSESTYQDQVYPFNS